MTKVFISSTTEDLKLYRAAAHDAVMQAGCHPEMMEYWTAQGERPPLAECMRKVDDCELVIVVVAKRYGWVPEDQPGSEFKSITWLECEQAKRIVAFVLDENHPWPIEQNESYRVSAALEQGKFTPELATEVQRNLRRLDDFRSWLRSKVTWRKFTTPDCLRAEILGALGTNKSPLANPSKYLTWLREQTAWIDIRGLQVGAGKAYRFPIQDLYIPLTTSGHRADTLQSGRKIALEEALTSKRLVIVGDPGSGKTTFLRRIAYEHCAATGSLAVKSIGFPILIAIRDLEEHINNCHDRKHQGIPITRESADWLAHFLAAQGWDLDSAYFDSEMHKEETLVLLDGLDEAPDTKSRERMARLFENATQRYRECRFVVTTRPGAYQGMSTLAGFDQVQIEELGDGAVETFLQHWSALLFPGNSDGTAKHFAQLLGAVRGRPAIRRMARNPVMLTALAVVHWNDRRLPEQRAELYESILGWLAKAREKEGRERAERCLNMLGRLALAMQNQPRGRLRQVGKRFAAELIAQQFRSVAEPDQILHAEQFLEQEELDSGIIVRRAANFEFWHLTFQEHLAGRAIAGLTDKEQEIQLFKSGNLYKSEWREVVLLYAGLLATKQGQEKVDAFLSLMLDRQGTSLAEQARCAGLLGRILADLKPLSYELLDPRYPELLNRVMAIFDRDGAASVPLKLRIEAAEALGQAGDPRLREADWVTIPAGVFTLGEGEEPHRIELRSYQIARYPLTVEEYARYVEEGGAEPEDWDKQLQFPNRPVVNVSWHDATAYCHWAGVRLPTGAEWERAARGTEGRPYPWGFEEPDPTRANYEETKVCAPTPVGLFPAGATPAPEKIHDMAGNVWEWLSDWDGDYSNGPAQKPVGPPKGWEKALRGGSWGFMNWSLRAVVGIEYKPVHGNNDFGFRCARDIPS